MVNFDPIWSWPKPVQKPHPPILVGGDGANTFHRVVRYGDGWMPIGRRDDFKSRLADLNRMAADAGRDPIPVTIFGTPPRSDIIETYMDAGIDRALFALPPAPRDEVLPVLDNCASVANGFK